MADLQLTRLVNGIQDKDAHHRLAIAILALAVLDYWSDKDSLQSDAVRFLTSPWGRFLWDALDWPLSPLHVIGEAG